MSLDYLSIVLGMVGLVIMLFPLLHLKHLGDLTPEQKTKAKLLERWSALSPDYSDMERELFWARLGYLPAPKSKDQSGSRDSQKDGAALLNSKLKGSNLLK